VIEPLASGGYFFAYFLDIISQFQKSSETSSAGSAERNVQTTFSLLYKSFQLIHHRNISISGQIKLRRAPTPTVFTILLN